jgi:hypothetical protein
MCGSDSKHAVIIIHSIFRCDRQETSDITAYNRENVQEEQQWLM